MQDLKGKTAFITGGASGIGLAMAEAFGREGMNVMLADIEATVLAAAVDQLRGKQIRAGQMITWSREQGAQCTTRRSDYTTDPRHPEIVSAVVAPVASHDVESAKWTAAEDRGDHEPTFRLDTFDAI